MSEEAREGNEALEELRARLLEAALPHVPFDGWGEAALLAAGRELGLDTVLVLNAFPDPGRDLIEAYNHRIDLEMLERFDEEIPRDSKVRDKIAALVRLRLELLEQDKEAVRRGAAFLSLPFNAGLASRLLWRTVDIMWYAAGDTATDYNYYSKRALLYGVYSSTFLYWLNDRSENYDATWAFLDRRIDEVLKVGGRLGKTMSRFMSLPERVMGAQKKDSLKSRLTRRKRPFTPRGY